MRITAGMQYEQFLASLQAIRQRLAEIQLQGSSGKKLNRPSDDPAAAGEAVSLRSRVEAFERFGRNISSARAILGTAESAIADLNNTLVAARSEAIVGASETNSANRADIANTVDALRDQLFVLARTRYQGRFIFSGTDTQNDPYDASGNYLGNTGEIRVETGDGETTAITQLGTDVFGAGTGVFGLLEGLATALRNDDTAAIQASADAIEAARQTVSSTRARVGERLGRMNASEERTANARLTLLTRLSELEDADLAEVVTRFAVENAATEATLAFGARIGRPNLFDFLG